MTKEEYLDKFKSQLKAGGVLFKHKTRKDAQGDSLHAVFPNSKLALAAAKEGGYTKTSVEPTAKKLEGVKAAAEKAANKKVK